MNILNTRQNYYTITTVKKLGLSLHCGRFNIHTDAKKNDVIMKIKNSKFYEKFFVSVNRKIDTKIVKNYQFLNYFH